MKKHSILITTAYLIVAGIIPTLLTYNLSYILAYGHLFLYPIFFGPFVVVLLYKPTIYALGLNKVSKFKWQLIGLVILIALLVTVGDGTSGNHAIWELSSNSITEVIEDHFQKPTDANREYYAEYINEKISIISNWSLARPAYLISVFLQSFVLLSFFLVLSIVAIHEPRDEVDSIQKRTIIIHLSLAYLFSLMWLTMRLIFLFTEKYKLYAPRTETFYLGNVMIVILFIIAFFYIIYALWIKYDKIVEAALTVIGGLGLSVPGFIGFVNSDSLPDHILRGISLFEYIFVCFCLLLFSVPYILRTRA